MKRVVTITVAVALLAGCSSGEPRRPVAVTRAPVDAASPSASPTVPPAAGGTSLLDQLPLPDGHDEAIPGAHGTGDRALPPFPQTGTGYTVYFVCTGGGKVELERRKESKLEPWLCDGVPTRLRVRSDARSHSMKVDVIGNAQWAIRIVHGLAERSALPPTLTTT